MTANPPPPGYTGTTSPGASSNVYLTQKAGETAQEYITPEDLMQAFDAVYNEIAIAVRGLGPMFAHKIVDIVGDGTTTDFAVPHNIGTEDVRVTVLDLTGTAPVDATGVVVERTDANTVTVKFKAGAAPAAGATFRIVVSR